MPSITIADLNNAKTDVDHIADVSTSLALTSTDRLGHVKDTITGAVSKISAFYSRGAWASTTAYAIKDLVSNGGTWYVCVVAHTSSALFATDTSTKWRVYQGVVSGDLASSSGSSMVGFGIGHTVSDISMPIGSSLIGHVPSGLSAVATTVQQQLRNIQGWNVNVCDAPFYAKGNANYESGGVWYEDAAHTIPATDDTAAINAAIASFPAQGTPTWRPWVLGFPAKGYLVSSAVSFKNQQGSVIAGYGAKLRGNFNGTILEVGDTSGSNDVNWSKIIGLSVEQYNTGLSANAVIAQHCYTCSFYDGTYYGGRYAFVLDGNNNNIESVSFRGAITANVVTSGAGGNSEVNTFNACAFEQSAGYGVDLQVSAGLGGFTNFYSCYFEANAGGNVRAKNSSMFRIAESYFNLQNNAAGILLDGTVGAAYPDGYGLIENNRILGPSTGSADFIQEISATSINCSYQNNQVESGTVNLYGSAPKSINLRRKKKQAYVANKDTLPVVTNAIVGWTNGGAPTLSNVSAFSKYGAAGALAISGAGYVHQTITIPAGSLMRVSVWGKSSDGTTVAALQLWSAGLGGQYVTGPTTTSTTGALLETFLNATTRTSATTFVLMLRNVSGAGTAQFCDIEVEDMTV